MTGGRMTDKPTGDSQFRGATEKVESIDDVRVAANKIDESINIEYGNVGTDLERHGVLDAVNRAYACGLRDARGTCHIIKDFRPSSMTQATSTDRCSECGHVFGRSSRDEMLGICYQDYDAPYYCPHCGARVVSA